MKAKILLLYSNVLSDGNIPVGISMLSAVLKTKHEVRLFDTTFYPKNTTNIREEREKSLEYIKVDSKSLPPLNTTDMYEDFDKLYLEFKPDIVAISANSNCVDLGFSFLNNVDVPVLFGGIHATIAPEDLIKHSKVTHVFRGEAEEVILDLVEKILNSKSLEGFSGVWYKKEGKTIKNNGVVIVKNLDNLPLPDWSIYDDRHFFKPYKGEVYRIGGFELSRGCPYSCSYCINHILQKLTKSGAHHYREKSVERALMEVKTLTKKYKIDLVKFWDENFLGYKKRSMDFLERYPKEVGLPLMLQTRPESITEEFARALKEANCINVSMGIESGNENIRRNILKRYPKNEDIMRGFQLCRKYGLKTTAYMMIGLPTETRKEIFETIDLARRCQPSNLCVLLVYPYKGTEIREWFIQHNWLDPNKDYPYVDNYFGYILDNPNLSKEEIVKLKKVFPLYVYTDPKYYSIIERAEKDELFFPFLNELYSKVIFGTQGAEGGG